MNFTDIFVRRPVLAMTISLLLLVLGLRSVFTLPVLQYPRTENAVVTVSTTYYGADADVVDGFITTPLENAIAQANGIDYMTSESKNSVSTITASLRLNYDSNKAMSEINTKVNSVLNQLPPQSQQPVITMEVGETIAAMYIGFKSGTLDRNAITDYLLRVVQTQLQAVEGVQTAELFGAQKFALRAWLDPDRLTAYKLTAADVSAAIAANNYISGLGTTKGQMVQFDLNASTDLKSLDEFRRMIVKEQDGAIVRLEDIANVTLGADDYESRVAFDGKEAVYIGIKVAPSANLLEVIGRIQKLFPQIQAALPTGLEGAIVYDSTKFVRSSINEVISTLVESGLIVTFVIFLFLGSPRAVFVPVIAIPLSLVGTFTMMMLFGFSINLLTLLALVLAIGLVVDDAIIVVENVDRHMDEGLSPFEAALKSAHELAAPIITMTIVLISVFLPIGFQTGLTGALFTEFAFTLVGAVTISTIVALTLSPMMCSRILKAGYREAGPNIFFAAFEWLCSKLDAIFLFFTKPLVSLYKYMHDENRSFVTAALGFGFALIYIVTLSPLFLPLAAIYFLRNLHHVEHAYAFMSRPIEWLWTFGFNHPFYSALTLFIFPFGVMLVYMVLFSWALVPLMAIHYLQRENYEKILDASFNYLPVTAIFALLVLASNVGLYLYSRSELAPQEDQGVVITIGSPAPNATLQQRLMYSREAFDMFSAYPEMDHVFQMDLPGQSIAGVVLKPWDERERTATMIQPLIQKDVSSLAGVNSTAIQPSSLPGSRGMPVQFVIKTTDDYEKLLSISDEFLAQARKTGKFMFINNDLKLDLPQTTVQIDRDKASTLGLSMSEIGGALSSMLGGGYVNYFSFSGRSYKVIPQVEQKSRLNADQLENYHLRASDGSTVPLSTIATLTTKATPEKLNHFQQMRAATISGVMLPGIALGDAMTTLDDVAKTSLPEGYSIDYAGQSRQYVQEQSGFLGIFMFALIITFLVLSAQFESFRDPITILISVPMATAGALLFICLGLGHATMNIYTWVGLVTLMGLISKHGILIAEFANKLMDQGIGKRQAIITASGVRLRPILMTTSAMVLGVMPLIFASGAGAVSRFNMGLVIAAGLAIGTIFTLFVHPAVVLMVGEDHSKKVKH